MVLPWFTLPSIRQIYLALIASENTRNSFERLKNQHDLFMFYKGRHAMIAGLESVRKANGAASVVLLLPDLYCSDIARAFESISAKVLFYPIREDLSPNWPAVRELIRKCQEPVVFCQVDYFGFPNQRQEAARFARKHGLILLEDRAHDIPDAHAEYHGDLIIYSPWKIYPVPFTGVLLASKAFSPFVPGPTTRPPTINFPAWVIWRQVQRMLFSMGVPYHKYKDRINHLAVTLNIEDERPCLIAAGSPARSVFQEALGYSQEIKALRRRNYSLLQGCLEGNGGVAPLFDRLVPSAVPYAMPVLVHKGAQNMTLALHRRGIPAHHWPDLPDELLTQPEEHAVALNIGARLMLLPIHQDLKPRQIQAMGKLVNQLAASRQ